MYDEKWGGYQMCFRALIRDEGRGETMIMVLRN